MLKLKLRLAVCFALALLAFQLFSPAVGFIPSGAQTAYAADTGYYIDCSAAVNGSGTMASPWNALVSANNKSGGFGPGDAIYLKKGTACSGNLTPTGSGTSTAPIVIDAYGRESLRSSMAAEALKRQFIC